MKTKYVCETCGKEYKSEIEARICKTLHEDITSIDKKADDIFYAVNIFFFTSAIVIMIVRGANIYYQVGTWCTWIIIMRIQRYYSLYIYYLKKRAKDNSHQLDNEQIKWRKERIEEHGF